MKLLGLRLCAHDSNVTYYDGEHLKYKSFERDFQVKHFGFEGIYGWTRILDEWNIKPWFVDAIAIVLDGHVHNEIEYNPQFTSKIRKIVKEYYKHIKIIYYKRLWNLVHKFHHWSM